MTLSRSGPDRPVLLPSGLAWSTDAGLVGETLRTAWSAAARTLDDTRYLLPPLTWQIASETVLDCPTTDHRPENLRVLLLSPYALEALWSCHTALSRAAAGDPEGERLADLLSAILGPVHDTDLPAVVRALEKILAVVTLDLPAARAAATHLALGTPASPETRAAFTEILTAWRNAGVLTDLRQTGFGPG